MIYKRLKSGDMGKCPEKSPSPCSTYVIPVVIKQMYVIICHKNAHLTHAHTYK